MRSEPLLVVHGDGPAYEAVAAAGYDVISIDDAADADTLGIERHALCATGAAASAAAWLAVHAPERVSALILVAPEPPDAKLRTDLETLDAPTMVICGTHDALATSEAGREYKRLVARCDLVYVHAAHDVAADRPEAFAWLVGDFLARGEGHVVRLESRVLSA